MKALEAVLLTLRANAEMEEGDGKSMPIGRTAMQKLVYFASIKTGVDAWYYAHYYGPFSEGVSMGIARLWGKGFVHEEPPTHAKPGYTYTLTKEGERLGAMVTDENSRDYATIKSIVAVCREFCELRQPQMALASKIHYLVTRKGVPRDNVERLIAIGLKMGWEMDKDDVNVGQELLCKLGLDR